jgi:hypothetical protein
MIAKIEANSFGEWLSESEVMNVYDSFFERILK